jgi:hypothetical protein
VNQQDDWDEEEPLPAALWVFASPALDSHEATARRAADLIYSVHRNLVHGSVTWSAWSGRYARRYRYLPGLARLARRSGGP